MALESHLTSLGNSLHWKRKRDSESKHGSHSTTLFISTDEEMEAQSYQGYRSRWRGTPSFLKLS